jgi:hypothetical protein
MQAVAAKFFGCAGPFCRSFAENSLQRFALIHFILKQALKWGWAPA